MNLVFLQREVQTTQIQVFLVHGYKIVLAVEVQKVVRFVPFSEERVGVLVREQVVLAQILCHVDVHVLRDFVEVEGRSVGVGQEAVSIHDGGLRSEAGLSVADCLVLGLALRHGNQLFDLLEYLTAEKLLLMILYLLFHIHPTLRLVEQILTLRGHDTEALARIFVQSRAWEIQLIIPGSVL